MALAVPDAQAIAAARRALSAADPRLADLDSRLRAFEWRTRLRGFQGLVRAIVGQQVSTLAADAVWSRLEARVGEITPQSLLGLEESAFRECGFSGQKTNYAKGIAAAVIAGELDFDALPLEHGAAMERLVALKGVGTWTAEVHLMMAEHRPDAFPAGDIAIQEAIRWLDGLPARPSTEETYVRGEGWRPHRSTAAHMLWAWYTAVKSGDMPHPLGEAGPSAAAAASAKKRKVA